MNHESIRAQRHHSNGATALLQLPPEIRTEIYQYTTLPRRQHFYIDDLRALRCHALLQVSQTTRWDVLGLLYATNTFSVDLLSDQALAQATQSVFVLDPWLLSHIRSLDLRLSRRSTSCCRARGTFYLQIRLPASGRPLVDFVAWSACEQCLEYQRCLRDVARFILHAAQGHHGRQSLNSAVMVELMHGLKAVPTHDDYTREQHILLTPRKRRRSKSEHSR